MPGREYYTNAIPVESAAQGVEKAIAPNCRGILIASPLTGIVVKTSSGEEITLPNVTGAVGTTAIVHPLKISSIKSTALAGIPANRVYQLF